MKTIIPALMAAFVILTGPAMSAEDQAKKPGDPARGETLYLQYCRGCHGVDGRGGAHTFMPHIGNLTKKGYIDLLPDEHLHLVILEGGQAVGKSSYMPAWKGTLTEQDVQDIIAHIRRLPTY